MVDKFLRIPLVVAISCMGATVAHADDWSVSGFLRQEIAVKAGTDDNNMNNWAGNSFNGVTVPNTSFLAPPGATITRPASAKVNNSLNLWDTRLDLNLNGKLTENWSAHFKLRGVADEIGSAERAFRGVDLFRQPFGISGKGSSAFEVADKKWMFDLPAAYVDYSSGPLWMRFGNQQIAWGEAIFFRVSDQVNGLDLRRHSVLGVAAEEFSDSRVPALGVRGSYRFNENLDIEAFTQQFQPTLLGNRNSPYNVIPAQFIVDDKTGYDEVKNQWNFGAKLRGSVNDYGFTAFAIRRNNPDGVFSWAPARGATALPGSAFSGGAGTGVFSAQEWFTYAAHSRLDGFGALQTALNEFPGTTALGGNAIAAGCAAPSSAVGNVVVNQASASCILDTFFSGGDLNGWIQRKFLKENIFGGSVNHVFEGEPDSLLDQLIGRFEFSYTPNKQFTNPTLSQSHIVHNETQYAFITEKYHKFSSEVPATYIVGQWLHKSASDIFGRALEGNNNNPGSAPKGVHGGANYVALAIQQPSPTLEWRFDLTALTDLKGGWLIQPGTRWRLNKSFQLDIYGNYIRSTTTNRTNFAQDMEYAREVFSRVTFFF